MLYHGPMYGIDCSTEECRGQKDRAVGGGDTMARQS